MWRVLRALTRPTIVGAVIAALLLGVFGTGAAGARDMESSGKQGVLAVQPAENGGGQISQLSEPVAVIQGGPINCSKSAGKKSPSTGTCVATFDRTDPTGDVIGLTATPEPGSEFIGWVVYPRETPSYRCGVEPVCYVLMADDVAVAAVFLKVWQSLTQPVTVIRQGTAAELGAVTSNPSGISCAPGGASCSHGFPLGTSMTLTATPGASTTFAGWGGACAFAAQSPTCSVTVASSVLAYATFNIATQRLTTRVQGPSRSGSVTADVQPGISCPSSCSASYAQGSSVTLTATPTTGYRLAGWKGGGCTGVNACVVTIGSAEQTVTATFRAIPVAAAVRSAKVVLTGRGFKTRQVLVQVRTAEPVQVEVSVRRGRTTVARRSFANVGPGDGVAAINLRSSLTAGKAQVRVTFTNSSGVRSTQSRTIVVAK